MDEPGPPAIELFGTRACPYTAELREQLLWDQRDFVEYDVGDDRDALERMLRLTDGQRTVPVLVENGQVTQIGWRGLGSVIDVQPVAKNPRER